MLFLNLTTGEFGLDDSSVRGALRHLSLPEDLPSADLTEFGFACYSEAPPPVAAWNERAREIAPVDGVQQWTLVPNGLTEEPAPPRRLIPKSVVQERVNAIGKLDEVLAILNSQSIFFARWFAPDWPNVYFDDEGLLQILSAVGCTPDEIETMTAP